MRNPIRKTIDQATSKWMPAALAVNERTSFPVPLKVLMGEARDLAKFVEQYWEPQTLDGRPIPGLAQATVAGLLRPGIAEELLELQLAASDQSAAYQALLADKIVAPAERAAVILRELRRALAFLFDDGVEDEQDAQLAHFDRVHARPTSHDAMALALEAYAHLAEKHRARMQGLPEFDHAVIDEALVVARRLREQSALKLAPERLEAQRTAISLRNRFATLLVERMRIVRSAVKYVFRNHPDIARKATSAYERKRRARSRRRSVSETIELAPGAKTETG